MEKKKVDAKEIVKDILDGMHKSALMVKYELSPSQLDRVMEKLREKGLLKEDFEKASERPPAPPPASGQECPNRRALIPDGADPCPQCGASLPEFGEDGAGPPAGPPVGYRPMRLQAGPGPSPAVQTSVDDEDEDEIASGISPENLRNAAIAGGVVVVLMLIAVLLGFGQAIYLGLLLLVWLFVAVYYVVILIDAFRTSILWGVIVLLCNPGALAFVVLHYEEIYKERLLAKIWLGAVGAATLLSMMRAL